MKTFIALALSILSSATPASEYIQLGQCEKSGVGISSLVPGLENQRSFYSGDVTLYRYNQHEPVSSPEGIAITFIVPNEEYFEKKCVTVPNISLVDLKNAESHYDPKNGLKIVVPIYGYDPETGESSFPGKIELKIKAIRDRSNSVSGYEVKAKRF